MAVVVLVVVVGRGRRLGPGRRLGATSRDCHRLRKKTVYSIVLLIRKNSLKGGFVPVDTQTPRRDSTGAESPGTRTGAGKVGERGARVARVAGPQGRGLPVGARTIGGPWLLVRFFPKTKISRVPLSSARRC
jgi:hypothetical protein